MHKLPPHQPLRRRCDLWDHVSNGVTLHRFALFRRSLSASLLALALIIVTQGVETLRAELFSLIELDSTQSESLRRGLVAEAWATPDSLGKSSSKKPPKQRARAKRRKHPIMATFRCTLSLHELRIRHDSVHPEQELIVKLFGPKKEYLYAWSIKPRDDQESLKRSFSWSSCIRGQAMILVVYAQEAQGGLRVVGELPLRADLISRMPEQHETKEVQMRLSGGDIRLLSLKFEITAVVLKKLAK